MKVLITGISGFVGQHLKQLFIEHSIPVFGTSRKQREEDNCYTIDLLSEEQILSLLILIKPTHIFHLAGISNVAYSWSARREVIEANTITTINLLEAVKKVNKEIRVITIGSSEEYGRIRTEKVSEKAPLNPISPYGVSKASVSMLIKHYHMAEHMDVIHVRPFNHIGPGQGLGFVTSDFAHQIALINSGKIKCKKIKIGNLNTVRDFTDVRDIVDAYYEIAVSGNAGEIYNVCSGQGIKVQKILDILLTFSKEPIKIAEDEKKMRPAEVPIMIGSHKKLLMHTKWKPQIPLEKSLHDIYKYWLEKT